MVRHSLYQRSARTWPLVYSLANTYWCRVSLDLEPQRGRAGRRFQADGLDLGTVSPS